MKTWGGGARCHGSGDPYLGLVGKPRGYLDPQALQLSIVITPVLAVG